MLWKERSVLVFQNIFFFILGIYYHTNKGLVLIKKKKKKRFGIYFEFNFTLDSYIYNVKSILVPYMRVCVYIKTSVWSYVFISSKFSGVINFLPLLCSFMSLGRHQTISIFFCFTSFVAVPYSSHVLHEQKLLISL